MKLKLAFGALAMYSATMLAQVQLTNGPELDNDRDAKMNRMLGGDDNSFYCYRVRSKGKGTSFIIEKYDKKTLKPLFSKEVNLDEEKQTKIEDVEYASGNVFIFRRQYDKKADKMTLFFQTISADGKVSDELKEITTVSSDHFEFVDFDIYPNPSQTKFLIKSCHKANKEDQYKTDFMLMDAVGMKKVWTKTVNQKLGQGAAAMGNMMNMMFGMNIEFQDAGFVGLYFDDNDNFYYGYTVETANSTKDARRYRLNLATMEAKSNTPKNVELTFDDDYFVRDLEFMKTNNNEIVVGGYIKDVIERKGADLVKVGIFSFKVNLGTNSVASKTIQFFDDKMLFRLESNARRSKRFRYKLDYIIPVGDAVYYIGEQYNEYYVNGSNNSSGYWQYEYMDVIIAKLNSTGKFEWIQNVPFRQMVKMNYVHVFKQYIAVATNKNIYILGDDHPKNMERYEKPDFEPRDLKSVQGIHGSNFVCNAVALTNGDIKRSVVFANEDYCFAPIQERNPQFIPPEDAEIFVPSKNNEIFIYTEDRGRDRFAKLKFE